MSILKTIAWPQVILFGDSITQFSFQAHGWGSELANKLARKCDVVNRGFSGYNSRWAKIILPRLIHKSSSDGNGNIAAVTVFFGANDCSLQEQNIQQHIPLQEYRENLKDMVKYLISVGVSADKIILITPPPLCEPAWEQECLLKGSALNRRNSVVGQYAEAAVQAAGQCGVDALNLWSLMQAGQDFNIYLSDGLHLSDKGNEFVANHLWNLLEKRVAHLPMILPYWGDVNATSPEKSLLSE